MAPFLPPLFDASTSNEAQRATPAGADKAQSLRDVLKLSNAARRAIKNYGEDACLSCYYAHKRGEGAASIANGAAGACIGPYIRTTRQADAAISAGRELAEGRK